MQKNDANDMKNIDKNELLSDANNLNKDPEKMNCASMAKEIEMQDPESVTTIQGNEIRIVQ